MDNVPGILINENDEVEEPSPDLNIHDVGLPLLIGGFCMFRTGGFPYRMLLWRYEVVSLQYPVDCRRGKILNILVYESVGNLPEGHYWVLIPVANYNPLIVIDVLPLSPGQLYAFLYHIQRTLQNDVICIFTRKSNCSIMRTKGTPTVRMLLDLYIIFFNVKPE